MLPLVFTDLLTSIPLSPLAEQHHHAAPSPGAERQGSPVSSQFPHTALQRPLLQRSQYLSIHVHVYTYTTYSALQLVSIHVQCIYVRTYMYMYTTYLALL